RVPPDFVGTTRFVRSREVAFEIEPVSLETVVDSAEVYHTLVEALGFPLEGRELWGQWYAAYNAPWWAQHRDGASLVIQFSVQGAPGQARRFFARFDLEGAFLELCETFDPDGTSPCWSEPPP
ncbi:MAG: hypothetical protein AAGA56_25195, partial [Myxococcota bacterium]